MACDNLGGLNKAQVRHQKVRAGAKHTDILRCFWRIHAHLHRRLDYKHVYGHQDRWKMGLQMSLLDRLNCKCDTLAKAAVYMGINNPPEQSLGCQRLPLESVSIFYQGSKGVW